MKLAVQELDTSLEQDVTPSRNTIVVAIRPHLYRHNFASGGLKLQILDESDTLVSESGEIQIEDIGTSDFFHGYVRFYINAYLERDTKYTVKMLPTGSYSFDESAYIGWANSFDLAKYSPTTLPFNVAEYPLDLEIWHRKEK
jgi:hypothetical protein